MLLVDRMNMTIDGKPYHVDFGHDRDELVVVVYGGKSGWWKQIGEVHTTDNFLTMIGHLEGLIRYMEEHA